MDYTASKHMHTPPFFEVSGNFYGDCHSRGYPADSCSGLRSDKHPAGLIAVSLFTGVRSPLTKSTGNFSVYAHFNRD